MHLCRSGTVLFFVFWDFKGLSPTHTRVFSTCGFRNVVMFCRQDRGNLKTALSMVVNAMKLFQTPSSPKTNRHLHFNAVPFLRSCWCCDVSVHFVRWLMKFEYLLLISGFFGRQRCEAATVITSSLSFSDRIKDYPCVFIACTCMLINELLSTFIPFQDLGDLKTALTTVVNAVKLPPAPSSLKTTTITTSLPMASSSSAAKRSKPSVADADAKEATEAEEAPKSKKRKYVSMCFKLNCLITALAVTE